MPAALGFRIARTLPAVGAPPALGIPRIDYFDQGGGVVAAGSKTPGRRAVVGYGRLPGWQRSDSRRIFAGCRLNAPTPFALSASQSAMTVSWYSLVASASNYWERTMCTRSSGVPFLPASYRGNSSSRIRRITDRAPASASPSDALCAM
jgi:hypothetical protein